jgi:hypothetical protein
MKMQTRQWSTARPGSAQSRSHRTLFAVLLGTAAWLLSGAAFADRFVNAYYDAQTDELVVTMSYRGTNPDHTFSLQWGECRNSPDSGANEIVADVNDSQWHDAAHHDFKKTTRFSLENLTCRPAKLTLRTAPRTYYRLQIPELTPR